MNIFLLNIILAMLWAASQGSTAVAHLFVGFVIGYVALYLTRPLLGPTKYFSKFWALLSFMAFLIVELIKSNIRVAWDVLTPRDHNRPGIVAVPLDAQTELEIMLLANLITLTPGTLSLDVSEDRSVLYVHSMFVDDVDSFRRDIKNGFERRVLELLR